ncbi:MAG: branched-chain amino acid ABC transporter permease [Candidatus Bathyarchaeia archaeon]
MAIKLPVFKWELKMGILVVLIILALLAPYLLSPFYAYLLALSFAFSIATLGFNLLFGYAGLLSFGHAGFFGLGAYTAALLMKYYGVMDLEVMLAAAIFTVFLFSAFVGFLCIRHVKIFFAVITLAFAQIIYSLAYKLYYITGGSDGISFPTPRILSIDFSGMQKMLFLSKVYYYYVFAFLLGLALIMWMVTRSHFGLSLKAVKDNPIKASSLGISVGKIRWLAFVISGVYAGIAGVLFSPLIGHVDPKLAYWTFSGEIVMATLLGGHGQFIGPIIGGILFIFLKNFATGLTVYWQLILGAILVIICIAAPGGLAGGLQYLSYIRALLLPGMTQTFKFSKREG